VLVDGRGVRLVHIAVLTILLSSPFIQVASARTELAYDDGVADGRSGVGAGGYQAVLFTLPVGWLKARIIEARYYLTDKPAAFKVHIIGGDGVTELLTPPPEAAPTGVGWFDVDLTAYNLEVSGDFYVAIECEAHDSPGIGWDGSRPDGRSYYGFPGSWTLFGASPPPPAGDLMIRIVVEGAAAPIRVPSVPVGGVLAPANKLAILAPYLALIGLASEVAVAFIRRRR